MIKSTSEPAADAPILAARQPWRVRDVDLTLAAQIETALGLHPITARVLVARGFDTVAAAEGFLAPGLDELHSPFAFVQMEAAVDRLMSALRNGDRIAVHGDYDVDGITGAVLLVTVLRHLGGGVELILPHRIDDGYGLNPSGIDKAHAAGAAVLIAVDCGITALEACAHARSLGIDVIVVDHHLPRPELPQAIALLNPRLPDSGYPEQELAAVGVAFKLARGLLERHPTRLSGISMLKLVALGTVADLVPLRGENRVMAFHGLLGLANATNPGLKALMDVAGVDAQRVSASDIAFRLAPRINAAGRLAHPNDAAEMFLTADPARARKLAGKLQRLNALRQDTERGVYAEAVAVCKGEDPITVVSGDGWHRGVIGIVASRLVERFGRPALVISTDGETAHGSARSVPGFNVVAALEAVAHHLTAYGGHHQAAGFQLPANQLDALRASLIEHADRQDPEALCSTLTCDAELQPESITAALALELERLAPFGIGNPRPRFLCRDLRLAAPPRLLKEEHVKLYFRGPEADIEAVGWRRADLAESLRGAERISLVATLRARKWKGRLTAQLEIGDVSA